MSRVLSSFYRLLSSLKVAVVLIALLIFIAVLSTIIPQHAEEIYYFSHYGNVFGSLIVLLRLHTSFQSLFFIILLILFFINTLLCTFKRIRKVTTKRPSIHFFKNDNAFVYRKEITEEEPILLILKRHRYRIIKAEDGSGAYYGYRGFLAKIGVDIVHCAVLLIIIGGLVSALTKHEYLMWLHEGDSHQLPTKEIITLDKFEYLKYDDGTPRDWLSHVTVYENGVEIREAVIEVNKPLRHEGYLVYQSSYEYEYTLTIQIEYRDLLVPYSVKVGDVIFLDDFYLHMKAFIPSQSMDKQAEEREEDSTLNIDIYDEGQYIEQMHVSTKKSKASGIPIQAELISVEYLITSGLTVKKEAGFSIIIVAFVLITLGLIFNFYLSEKVIKVFKKDGKCFLFGGFVRKNSPIQTREWECMVRNRLPERN